MIRVLVLILILLANTVEAAGPRVWGKSGTATDTNATLTVGGTSSFGPTSLCFENTGATNNIFIDWSDGIATTTDNSTNIKIPPSKGYCFNFENDNVMNIFTFGIITSAATTSTYNAFAMSAK